MLIIQTKPRFIRIIRLDKRKQLSTIPAVNRYPNHRYDMLLKTGDNKTIDKPKPE